MTQTNPPQPPMDPHKAQPLNYQCACARGDDFKGSAVFSIAFGVFLVFFMPRFFQWVLHRLFHTQFNPIIDTATGAMVPYTQSIFFWADLGPAVFAIASIIEGVALLVKPKKPIFLLAAGIMAISAILNTGYVLISFGKGYGFAPFSFLAAFFGVYSVMTLMKAIGVGAKRGCGQDDCHCRH